MRPAATFQVGQLDARRRHMTEDIPVGRATSDPTREAPAPPAAAAIADPAPLGLAGFALSSFGAFWLSFWAFVAFYAKLVPADYLGKAVGLYLIAWGIFTAYMWIASF